MIRIFNQLISAKILVLISAEALLILLSFLAATRLWFWNDPAGFAEQARWPEFVVQCLFQIGLLQTCFYYNGLYSVRGWPSPIQQLVSLMQAIGALCIISAALYFFLPLWMMGREVLILALVFSLAAAFLTRVGVDSVWRATAMARNLLVLGTGPLAAAVALEIDLRDDLNLNLAAFAAKDQPTDGLGSEFLGRPVVCLDHLEDAVRRLGVSQIIVALEDQQDALPVAELVRLRLGGTTVSDAPELLSALSGRVRLDVVTPGGLLFGEGSRPSETPLMWKRGLDLFFGLIGACIFAPIMALVALAVWLDCGRPILLWQTRVGWKGKEFRLLKFRTMRVDAEPNGEAQWAAVNDPRVTRVGAFLRAYHLDELPQFINVIRGEMSFVGPRPERPGFVAHLRAQIPYYEERLLVRPGVTGWAQVQYPYAATVADAARKLEYDLFYLKNMSFAFDCAIALKTVRIVLLKWGSR